MSKISEKFVWGILVKKKKKTVTNFPNRTLEVIVFPISQKNNFIIINVFNSQKLAVIFLV